MSDQVQKALHPLENGAINGPEEDVESFRALCQLERPEQLRFFSVRFIKLLQKEGIREVNRVASDYEGKIGKNKEFPVVSTEFTDFIDAQQISFASMKARKVAFRDLDIDGNAHISLIEVLVFMNKDMILKCSEKRWSTMPPSEGPEYTAAVLKELFLPAQDFDPSFDSSLTQFMQDKAKNLADVQALEDSKEGLGGVKKRNVDQKIAKLNSDLEQMSKNFDLVIKRAPKIGVKANAETDKIKAEIETEDLDANKHARGAVKKGAFEGK